MRPLHGRRRLRPGDRVRVTGTASGLSGCGLLLLSEKLVCARAALLRFGADIEVLGPSHSAAR